MPNDFDKILRESYGGSFLKMVQRWYDFEIGEISELPTKLQKTIEREPDFLKMVKNPDGSRFILHIEHQTYNDPKMIERMRTYHALLMEKYRVPVRQVVIYVGRRPPKMRNQLEDWEIMTGFELRDIARMDYREFLDSEDMEEIVFSILADRKDISGAELAKLILNKLYRIGGDKKETHLAIEQLLVLSRISKLDSKVEFELKNMPFTIDITKDRLYKRGMLEGIAKGERKGKLEGKAEERLELALKMLNAGIYSWDQIESLTGNTRQEVLEFKKKTGK